MTGCGFNGFFIHYGIGSLVRGDIYYIRFIDGIAKMTGSDNGTMGGGAYVWTRHVTGDDDGGENRCRGGFI